MNQITMFSDAKAEAKFETVVQHFAYIFQPINDLIYKSVNIERFP